MIISKSIFLFAEQQTEKRMDKNIGWDLQNLFWTFQNNKLQGQATIFASNGDRIELNYDNGVVHGKANIRGNNGDRESCSFLKGVKHGPATYIWKAGHK